MSFIPYIMKIKTSLLEDLALHEELWTNVKCMQWKHQMAKQTAVYKKKKKMQDQTTPVFSRVSYYLLLQWHNSNPNPTYEK